ncbi:MAG TPA: hypothetical protein VKT31_12135 [Solirubrobacteraceae bacterium]|nr:hypothetical protein [Solirubrobacteraceae bacterium]
MRDRMTIALAVLALALTWAGTFAAGSSQALEPAWADCNANARLTHHYTPSQLQSALVSMPADVREYTNCNDVLEAALRAELAGAGGGSGGSGGSFLPTPVVVVLVLLLLAAAGLGAVALRRRRESDGGEP